MGIEQRIDLLSPLQGLMARVGEAMKAAMPNDAKVKIELETTPLQEVEASINRVKTGGPETAATKLGAAEDPSLHTAAAQEEVAKVFQRMEAAATRINYLLGKIDSGKDATGNAAQEVERLRDSLERVATKGREAAKSLGNEGLAAKITEAEKAASVGQGGKAAESGVSAGNLLGMIRSPEGAMMQGGEMLLQKLLTGGGGGGIMNFLGPVAAVAGGIYGGWKINSNLANEATTEAGKAVADYRLSHNVGNSFDFRETLFDDKGFGPRYANQDLRLMSNPEVRRVLSGMGVGVDNWTTRFGQQPTDGLGVANTAMLQSTFAYRMGVSTDQISGMVGANVRTGGLAPDDMAIHMYLREIAGATSEAAKSGVTASEKLSVIASLNQRSVAATGYLSPEQSKLNMRASAALEATGDPALKGQLGQSALEVMGGSGSDEARAREISFMMTDGDLDPEYKKLVASNPNLKRIYETNGPVAAADAILDDPTLRAGVNQRAVRFLVGAGNNPMLAARMMGVNANTSKTGVALSGFLEGNDILTQTLAVKDQSVLGGPSKREQNEEKDYKAMLSGDQRGEVLKTGYDRETAKNLNEAATKLNAAADNLGRWLSNGSFADALIGGNPLTADPYWITRGLH